jgi:hypothetical protein
LFTGAFYLAVAGLKRLNAARPPAIEADLWRLRPYIISVVVGTIVGMLSSTRSYVIPTYLILGMAAAYMRLTAHNGVVPPLRFDRPLMKKLAKVSLITFVATYCYIRMAVHWS